MSMAESQIGTLAQSPFSSQTHSHTHEALAELSDRVRPANAAKSSLTMAIAFLLPAGPSPTP
jgi:hypothetical protein